jgi:hypothetical protein
MSKRDEEFVREVLRQAVRAREARGLGSGRGWGWPAPSAGW